MFNKIVDFSKRNMGGFTIPESACPQSLAEDSNQEYEELYNHE
jgi:hypothetical protein